MEVPAHLYVASNELRSPGERPEFRFPNGLYQTCFYLYEINLIKHIPYVGKTFIEEDWRNSEWVSSNVWCHFAPVVFFIVFWRCFSDIYT